MICRYFGTLERQIPEWQVFVMMMRGDSIFIGFDAIGFFFKKTGMELSALLLVNCYLTSNPFGRLRVVPSGMVKMTL
jgi:hypothetical protein